MSRTFIIATMVVLSLVALSWWSMHDAPCTPQRFKDGHPPVALIETCQL